MGIFFTLSGYLITDLLLAQQDKYGRLRLGEFWLRRARRLLPGLVVMLTVVAAWVTLLHRSQLSALRGATVSALGFAGNWWLIVQHVSYFARFGPPTPLGHLWSLAVEEQFYLLWPWLLLLGLRLRPTSVVRRGVRPRLAGATVLLATASAVAMVLLYRPGFDTTRVYDGTDTRAFGLLFGAALAMLWPSRQLRARIDTSARWLLDTAGGLALLVIGLLIVHTNEYSPFLYRGGLLLSLATAVVVAVAAHPAALLGRVLGWAPLRWLGVRSYGIYLWHLPVIGLTGTATGRGPDPARAVLQVTASIGLAALSWRYIEEPIRRGAMLRRWRQYWAGRRIARGWTWVVPTGAIAVLATACVGLTSATPTGPASRASALSHTTSTAGHRTSARGQPMLGPHTPARRPPPRRPDRPQRPA